MSRGRGEQEESTRLPNEYKGGQLSVPLSSQGDIPSSRKNVGQGSCQEEPPLTPGQMGLLALSCTQRPTAALVHALAHVLDPEFVSHPPCPSLTHHSCLARASSTLCLYLKLLPLLSSVQ